MIRESELLRVIEDGGKAPARNCGHSQEALSMQKHWPGDSQSDDSVGSFALMHRLKTKPGVDGTQIVHGNLACPYQKNSIVTRRISSVPQVFPNLLMGLRPTLDNGIVLNWNKGLHSDC